MSKTPDSLTQAEFRGKGYHVIKVESWGLHPMPHRTDFLGIFDYLAFNDAGEMIAIQTTTWSNASSRRKKMLNSISFEWWTQGGRQALLLTWECLSKQRGIWKRHEEWITLAQWKKFQEEKKRIENTLKPLDKNSKLFKKCPEMFEAVSGHVAANPQLFPGR